MKKFLAGLALMAFGIFGGIFIYGRAIEISHQGAPWDAMAFAYTMCAACLCFALLGAMLTLESLKLRKR